MPTPYTYDEDCAIAKAWVTLKEHFEDLGNDIDQSSDAWWNRVFIIFVVLDGNCNSRTLKLVRERFVEIFEECEAFKKELKSLREVEPDMLGVRRISIQTHPYLRNPKF